MSNIKSEVSSFSTEPEAGTLSQSEFEIGFEGTKLNEFFKLSKPIENDAQSEVSDLQSYSSSKLFRVKDNKKSNLSMIAALKNENLMLKAALDKANMIDISTVQTKLRVTHNDLILYKQYNSELKDRVQELESRLYEALQQKKSGISKEVLTDRGHHEKIRSLISKNDHLGRLIKSYERRILNMQSELDSFRLKGDVIAEGETVVHVQSSYGNGQYRPFGSDEEEYSHQWSGKVSSQLPFADSGLTPEVQALIREQAVALTQKSRETDRKTISELAREVKRLTALLPRKLLSTNYTTSERKEVGTVGSVDGKEYIIEDGSSVTKQENSLLDDDRIIVCTNSADSVRIIEDSGRSLFQNEFDRGTTMASSKIDSAEVDLRRSTAIDERRFTIAYILWIVLKIVLIIFLLIVLTLVGLVVIFG